MCDHLIGRASCDQDLNNKDRAQSRQCFDCRMETGNEARDDCRMKTGNEARDDCKMETGNEARLQNGDWE